MATSVNATGMTVEECLSTVQDISRVSSVQDPDPSRFLSNLLRLLPCLEAPHLTTADLSTLRHKIWKDDLVHMVIEVLRDDTSHRTIRNIWRKLTSLAVILSSTLTGLSPKESRTRRQPPAETSAHSEHIREYYDIILPTATDSILILASNILEVLEADQDNSSGPELLECFKRVVESLVSLCAGHGSCVHRALQSPYLLNILITDHSLYGHLMLVAMETIMLADRSAAACIPHDVLSSIVDELVYKLSGSDGEGARLSLRLLAQLSATLPGLSTTLSNGYAGLLTLVRKWTRKDRQLGAAEKFLVSELELQAGGRAELDEKQKAALFIQASWRGYASRKKMIAAKRGIRKFQLLFRKRRAERLKRRDSAEYDAVKGNLKLSHLRSSQLDFHQKQLTLYEQQPASELKDFIHTQENKAAIKIQSVWRAHAVRTQIAERKSKMRSIRSAVVIQRAFRHHMHSREKQREKLAIPYEYLPELPADVRGKLQEEVGRYRDTHTSAYCRTQEQAVALHQEVQQEYEKFRFTQSTHAQSIEETRMLVSKLNRSCELMLCAPSLDKAFSMDGVEDTFSSKAPLVAKMGRTAHREELRAMNTPWWKRAPLDHQEVTL